MGNDGRRKHNARSSLFFRFFAPAPFFSSFFSSLFLSLSRSSLQNTAPLFEAPPSPQPRRRGQPARRPRLDPAPQGSAPGALRRLPRGERGNCPGFLQGKRFFFPFKENEKKRKKKPRKKTEKKTEKRSATTFCLAAPTRPCARGTSTPTSTRAARPRSTSASTTRRSGAGSGS